MNYFSKEDINSLQLPDTLIDHLARHFNNDSLVTGSMFISDFATTPIELLKKIKNHIISNNLTFPFNGKRCEISLKFNDQVGWDSIIRIDKLTKDEQKTIIQKRRDQENEYLVNFIKLDKKIPTNRVNVILLQADDELRILTIFPGELAPPIPNYKYHNPEEYKKYDTFWQAHAFII